MLDISKKIDKLDLEILLKVKAIANKLQIDFFIVGAYVRDIILNYIYNIEIYRKTNDIDFGVRVATWEQYIMLIKQLEKLEFKKDERIIHRYTYKGMLIDFIPFGDVTSNESTITWPDNDKKEMNVMGFDDAYLNTEDILIQADPDITIKAATLECLVILKLFAWNDRTIDHRLSDAKDLYLIIDSYLDAGNQEKLINEHIDIMEATEDYELSGARLLGRDIAKIASDKVKNTILELLNSNKLNSLASDMSQFEGLHLEGDDRIAWCVKLLNSLFAGLEDEVS